jgi:hypothetical protein
MAVNILEIGVADFCGDALRNSGVGDKKTVICSEGQNRGKIPKKSPLQDKLPLTAN